MTFAFSVVHQRVHSAASVSHINVSVRLFGEVWCGLGVDVRLESFSESWCDGCQSTGLASLAS